MSAQQPAVLQESVLKPDFLDEIYEIPGGSQIKECIQCGTCSGSCPAAPFMDYTPRQIVAMIRAGMRDEVLASNSIWACASCYLCQVRCPSEIRITDMMYALKRKAIEAGVAVPAGEQMAQIFTNNINIYGRSDERLLIFSYYLKTDISAFFGYAPLGIQLLGKGLLEFHLPKKIKGIDQLQKIIQKANEEGD